eukprot:4825714-Pleurochrysis_carterae.AAC.4
MHVRWILRHRSASAADCQSRADDKKLESSSSNIPNDSACSDGQTQHARATVGTEATVYGESKDQPAVRTSEIRRC